MIVGSHNSWSYLPVKKWWMKLISFTAKCQDKDILTQYCWYKTKCFDLRVRFNKNKLIMAHGIVEYNYTKEQLFKDLSFLNFNKAYLRIIHEVRNKKQYTEKSINCFRDLCNEIEHKFPNITIWCGRNLYNWNIDYDFAFKPTCEEKYASVCFPKFIDDWYPRHFAKKNNKDIINKGTDKDILLIDFVNYGN